LKVIVYLLGAAALIIAALLAFQRQPNLPSHDPDTYFHQALSKQMVQQGGLLRALPQVEGLRWDSYFSDKEFFFHVITALTYRVGGNRGVIAVAPVLSVTILLLLYFILLRYVSPVSALLFSILPTLLLPGFVSRLLFLRPHLMGILFFLCLVYGLLRQSRVLTFFSCVFFALSYHLLPVPIVLLGFIGWIDWRRGGAWYRLPIVGLAGLALGILINPYFPSNLVMGWQHIKIPFELAFSGNPLPFGMELIPQRSDQFAKGFLFYALILLAGLYQLFTFRGSGRFNEKPLRDLLFLMLSCLFFWGLAALSPRSIEYAVPLSCLLLALLYSLQASKRRFLLGVILVEGILQVPGALPFYRDPMPQSLGVKSSLEALDQIQKDEKGKRILNCEWFAGSYILFKRENLKFLDLLDPSFLRMIDPKLVDLRSSLCRGVTSDVFGVTRSVFRSDYLLFFGDSILLQIERDPNFKRLYPEKVEGLGSSPAYLYQVAKKRVPNFITHFYAAPTLKPEPLFDDLSKVPTPLWKVFPGINDPKGDVPPVFWDLSKLVKLDKSEPNSKSSYSIAGRCWIIRPDPEGLAQHYGAQYVGIGGGPGIRVWLNQKPLYHSPSEAGAPRLLTRLVSLPQPFSAKDRLEFLVCDSDTPTFKGFALSFWSKAQLIKTCKEKGYINEPKFPGTPDKWQYAEPAEATCLAPFARAI
jgi:hypothetical protein